MVLINAGMHGNKPMVANNHEGSGSGDTSVLHGATQFPQRLVNQLESMIRLRAARTIKVLPMVRVKKMHKQEVGFVLP